MRILSLALASTLLLSGAAFAGPETGGRPTAQQMMEAEGSYALDNGERVRVFELDNRLYMEVGHHRKELLMDGPDRFVSKDGSISMRFQPGPGADKVVLGYRRDAQDGIPVRMASAAQRRGRGSAD